MKKAILKSILFAFLSSFLILSSCAKKSTSSSRSGAALRGTDPVNGVNNLSTQKCTDGSSTWGRLWDDGSVPGNNFRDSFANFLSGSMDPAYLGALDGSAASTETWVSMELKLKVTNNKLNLSESKFSLEIKDGKVGEKGTDGELLKNIMINFVKAEDGEISNLVGNTGNFKLVFKDSYGSVIVEGTFNGTEARGKVSFINTTHFNKETPKSGFLGVFVMKSCGLFL
jgi:hypothetical protein